MAPTQCNVRARIAFAITGLLVGVSIFFTFGFVYKNWDTAACGLASGVFAALALWVHVRYTQDEWSSSPNMLRPLMLLGCFGQLAGVVAFAVYLALGITEHQSLTPYGRGYYLACVWSFMIWKWGFLLFYFSRGYKNLYEQKTGLPSNLRYEKI